MAAFRVTRDSELDFDDEGGRDFLQVIEEELRNRRAQRVVRLEVEAASPSRSSRLLVSRLGVTSDDVYRSAGRSTSAP